MRDIIQYPNCILNMKSEPIKVIDSVVHRIAQDMREIVDSSKNCLALSAVQIGEPIQLIVVKSRVGLSTYLNPTIVSLSDDIFVSSERCMSVQNGQSLNYMVIRHKEIHVKVMRLNGMIQSIKEKGQLSVVLQHEIDHLNGITIVDKK